MGLSQVRALGLLGSMNQFFSSLSSVPHEVSKLAVLAQVLITLGSTTSPELPEQPGQSQSSHKAVPEQCHYSLTHFAFN